uniref:EGF-like domain-containing protein n=1 Tax=Trichuris muris TaxID=70415 RepID=A0A5S6PZ04_TRIMR
MKHIAGQSTGLYEQAMIHQVSLILFIICPASPLWWFSFTRYIVVRQHGYPVHDYDAGNMPCPDEACKNGGICHRSNSYKRCVCQMHWAGMYCEEAVTPCDDNMMCNGLGACVIADKQRKCACNWLYEGEYCEIRVKPFGCNRHTCVHGSCLINKYGVHGCKCFEGYAGDSCQNGINECASSPCQNKGTCINGNNEYFCECIEGFRGTNCQIPSCKPGLCLHGTCRNLEDGFECDCHFGFKGRHCNNIVDNQTTSSSVEVIDPQIQNKQHGQETSFWDAGKIFAICLTVLCVLGLIGWAIIKYKIVNAIDYSSSVVSHIDGEVLERFHESRKRLCLGCTCIKKHMKRMNHVPRGKVSKSIPAMTDGSSGNA